MKGCDCESQFSYKGEIYNGSAHLLQMELQQKEKKRKSSNIQFYFVNSMHYFNKSINTLLFETQSPWIAIIKPHPMQRIHSSLLDCFSALSDNQRIIDGGKYICKSFLSTSKGDPLQYDKFVFLQNQIDPKWVAIYNEYNFQLHYLFKQLVDIIKMQNDAVISNALLSESPPNHKYNYLFVVLNFYIKYEICRLSNGKQFKQRILFLNLSGKYNQDYEVHQSFQLQQNYLYIALQQIEKESQKKQISDKNFRVLQIVRTYKNIFWRQFKMLFKTFMKRDIELFNPTICILTIEKCFECQPSDYLSFEDECLHKIVKLMTKISKDRLIIHTLIQKYQTAKPNEMQVEDEKKESEQHSSLFQFLNTIYQGVIQSMPIDYKLQDYDQNYLQWLNSQMSLNQMNHQAYQMLLREKQNKNVTVNEKVEYKQPPGTPIIIHEPYKQDYNFQNYQPLIINLVSKGQMIIVSENSLLNIDYDQQLVCFFNFEDSNLYIGQWDQKLSESKQIECKRISLQKELQPEKNYNSLSMTIQKQYILLLPLKSNQILAIDHQTGSKCFLERYQWPVEQKKGMKNKVHYKIQEIEQKIEFRSRPGIVNTAMDQDFNFMVLGGEFINKQQVCNTVELIKIGNPSGVLAYSSVLLKKEILLEKNNFKPFPHMLVLVNNYQPYTFVFLPGDYDNKEDKYKSAINQEHYKYAMVLIVAVDSYKFTWERYEIYYEKNNYGIKPIQITEFTHKQHNIMYQGGLKWNIGLTKIEPKKYGKESNSQEIYFPYNQQFVPQNEKEGNFCVVSHLVELELTQRMDAGKTIKSLIIKQKSYQIGSTMLLTKEYLKLETTKQKIQDQDEQK